MTALQRSIQKQLMNSWNFCILVNPEPITGGVGTDVDNFNGDRGEQVCTTCIQQILDKTTFNTTEFFIIPKVGVACIS